MRLSQVWNGYVNHLPTYEIAPRARLLHHAHTVARESSASAAQHTSASLDAGAFAYPHRAVVRLERSGIHLSLADRWGVAGATGTGKTVFTQKLVNGLARLYPHASTYILDSKPDDHFDREPRIHLGNTLPPLLSPGERIVWRPEDNEVEMYDDFFGRILHAGGPTVVLVDELSNIGGKSGLSFPLNYMRLLKQGRSKYICVITCTQEAAFIPRQVFGQTTHLVRQRLTTESDAAKLDTILHGSAKPRREPTTRYGLIYRRLDTPAPAREFKDWKELLS